MLCYVIYAQHVAMRRFYMLNSIRYFFQTFLIYYVHGMHVHWKKKIKPTGVHIYIYMHTELYYTEISNACNFLNRASVIIDVVTYIERCIICSSVATTIKINIWVEIWTAVRLCPSIIHLYFLYQSSIVHCRANMQNSSGARAACNAEHALLSKQCLSAADAIHLVVRSGRLPIVLSSFRYLPLLLEFHQTVRSDN